MQALPYVIPAVSSWLGGQMSQQGQNQQSQGTQNAIDAMYQPQYTSDIDKMLYELLQKQQNYQMPAEYQGIVNQLMGQYSGMGQGSNYNNLLNTFLTESFKPQGDIYDYYSGKLRQNIGSQASAAGLGTSPFGVGLVGEGLESFTKDYATNEDARRMNALQAFLQGQQGVSGMGQGALSSALNLEQAKQYPISQSVAGMQNYLNSGINAGANVAPLYQQQGQQNAQPYNYAAQGMNNLASTSLQALMLKLLSPTTTPTTTPISNPTYIT